jgi:hypothetical protein
MKYNVNSKKTKKSVFSSIFLSSIFIYVISIIYFYAVYLVNKNFSSVFYWQYGFNFTHLSMNDIIVLCILTFIIIFLLPVRMNRSSSIFLVIIYFFVIVPFQVVGLSGDNSYESQRYTILFLVHLCFSGCCLACSRGKSDSPQKKPVTGFVSALLLCWFLTAVILIYLYRDIMTISGLDSIYAQRELGKATNLWVGYVQTYNQYVFSPALVAIGLAYKKPAAFIAGVVGAILSFSITAEKAGLMYPAFVVILYLMVSSKRSFASASSLIALGLSMILYISVFFQHENGRTDFILWYLGTRTLLVPGTFISLYQDFFSSVGYTNFSHIRVINLFVSIPDAYILDSRWPAIGLILGEDYLRIPTLNANANFIASDGVASLGLFGIPVAFSVLALYLRLLDRFTAGIDPKVTLPILLPVALTLTNGSVFTAMTSFGGIFWIIVFGFVFVERKTHR